MFWQDLESVLPMPLLWWVLIFPYKHENSLRQYAFFADVNYVVVGIWILDFIGVANPSTHRIELLSL